MFHALSRMDAGEEQRRSDDWDVSLGYDLGGGTKVTLASGADEVSKITVGATVGAIALSIGQEFGEDDETELSASKHNGQGRR